MIMTRQVTLVLALASFAAIALAGETVSETRKLDPNGVVEVENIAGSVRVSGWDQAAVEVTGDLGDGTEGLDVTGDERHLVVAVNLGEARRRNVDATDLVLRVPRSCEVRAETVSAEVEASGLEGTLVLSSVSGGVKVEAAPGEVELTSVSGDVRLLGDVSLRRGSFQTVSGDILVDTVLDPQGRYSFESVSGSIKIVLPADVAAEFEIETFSGDILNDFGPKAEKSCDFLPAKELAFTAGAGGALVTGETVSGNIRLTRK
jgi:DUF4097 and DUF4098 domain-containing protein YvlB